jgi:hypothetical protein
MPRKSRSKSRSRRRSKSRSRSHSRRAPKQDLRCQSLNLNGKQCRNKKGPGCDLYCWKHADLHGVPYEIGVGCVDGVMGMGMGMGVGMGVGAGNLMGDWVKYAGNNVTAAKCKAIQDRDLCNQDLDCVYGYDKTGAGMCKQRQFSPAHLDQLKGKFAPFITPSELASRSPLRRTGRNLL